MPKLDRKLNLVIPLERDGGEIYVHATPIAREAFEANFLLISKTFTAIYEEQLGPRGGPRVAALMLNRIAAAGGMTESATALMNEIRRLSNVIAPGPKGWDAIPLQVAVDEKRLDAEEQSEVENAIVFFIANSAMHRANIRPIILEGAATLWGARIESLSLMEFVSGLSTSMPVANTGAKAAASSTPS